MNGSVNPLLREYMAWNPLNDRETATVSAIPPPHRNQGGKYRPDSPVRSEIDSNRTENRQL